MSYTIHLCKAGVEFKVLRNVTDEVPGTFRPSSRGCEIYDNDTGRYWKVIGAISSSTTADDLFVDVEGV